LYFIVPKKTTEFPLDVPHIVLADQHLIGIPFLERDDMVGRAKFSIDGFYYFL